MKVCLIHQKFEIELNFVVCFVLTDDQVIFHDDHEEIASEKVSLGVTVANKIKSIIGYSPYEAPPNQRGRSLCRNPECPEPSNKWMSTQIEDGKCPLCFAQQ